MHGPRPCEFDINFLRVPLQDVSILDLRFGFLVNNCVYIAGWQRLGTSNLVKKSPSLVLNKVVYQPDQWVIGPFKGLFKGI